MHHERRFVRALVVLALAAAVAIPACGGGGSSSGGGGAPPLPFLVVTTTPNNGSISFNRTATIYLRFSAALNLGTLGGISLTQAGVPVPGATVTIHPCFNTVVRIQPASALAASTAYLVTVPVTVLSATGTAVTPVTVGFSTTVQADAVRPTSTGIATAGTPGTTSMALTWAAGADDVTTTPNLVYDVYVSTAGNTCFDFGLPPHVTSPAAATGMTVTGLSPNTAYFFLVRARDQAGNQDVNSTGLQAKTLVSFSANLYTPIINVICVTCHRVGGEGSHMILTGGPTNALSSWVNVDPGGGPPSLCEMPQWPVGVTKRVLPGNAADSLVYRKIAPDDPLKPRCGARMPLRGFPDGTNIYLNSAQIQTMFDWIQQGAMDN